MKTNYRKALKEFYDFLFFLTWSLFYYIVKTPNRFSYKNRLSDYDTLTLLSNAPSLKEVLPSLFSDNKFKKTDFVVLNFFALCNEFLRLKPLHYCFADPMFYTKNHRYNDVMSLFKVLNQSVDWDMNIYIVRNRKSFLNFSGLNNPHLKIIQVSDNPYSGYKNIRNWAYKHNFSNPYFSTVAILAIYIGINSGYKKINLYGVDMSFFDSLCVNEKNELCSIYRHFDDDKVEIKPIISNGNDKVYHTSEYVESIGLMFRSHDMLSIYAKSQGVTITNCTKCSLIDSYEREK